VIKSTTMLINNYFSNDAFDDDVVGGVYQPVENAFINVHLKAKRYRINYNIRSR